MTTQEYRRRFGYLAYCCPRSTGIWTDEMLADGIATLDPNVTDPLVEGDPGQLVRVPEVVLGAGLCMLTRTVHPQTNAGSLWRQSNKAVDQDHNLEPLSAHWPTIARLCEELGREAPGRHFEVLEGELNALISTQRYQDHSDMKVAIKNMLLGMGDAIWRFAS
jgi:hypothetical protein